MHKILKALTLTGYVAAFGYVVLLIQFAMLLPQQSKPLPSQVDGVVVFTGGSNRIETALSLLEDGLNVPVLISGVHPAVQEDDLLKEVTNSNLSYITLDYKSLSTRDNAQMTKQWANANDLKKVGVITSHYHMPRSLLYLKRANLTQTIHPMAVFPERMPISFLVREFHKYLLTRLHIL